MFQQLGFPDMNCGLLMVFGILGVHALGFFDGEFVRRLNTLRSTLRPLSALASLGVLCWLMIRFTFFGQA